MGRRACAPSRRSPRLRELQEERWGLEGEICRIEKDGQRLDYQMRSGDLAARVVRSLTRFKVGDRVFRGGRGCCAAGRQYDIILAAVGKRTVSVV